MSRDVVLGIDLGTTNSVVALADGGQARVLTDPLGNRLIPSVVSFKPDGTILVGEEARERRLIDAINTVYSVKRLIGRPFSSPEVRRAQERFAFQLVENPNGGVVVDIRGETYTLTEISAFVLREVRRVAEQMLGHSVSRAVITVPANFNELQRSATKAAGRVAGLDVARIINEPTAAALAYGYGKTKAERVAVYDLGGGTFDLTILELENDVFEVVATAGDSFLGGDDIDLLIAETMADQMLKATRWDPRQDEQAFERLRAAAEWSKCQLSTEDVVEATIEELAYGKGGKALDLNFRMERSELERKLQPIVGRSFDVCQRAMAEAGLKAKDIDSVVLVGGSTRVPLVRRMVGEFFGKAPRTDIDPDLVVAQGAAIHGYALGGAAPKRSLGRVALKKVSLRELEKLKAERQKRQGSLPKGPAFAPAYQVEEQPIPSERPARRRGVIIEEPAATNVQRMDSVPGSPGLRLPQRPGGEKPAPKADTAPRVPPRVPNIPLVKSRAKAAQAQPPTSAQRKGTLDFNLDDPLMTPGANRAPAKPRKVDPRGGTLDLVLDDPLAGRSTPTMEAPQLRTPAPAPKAPLSAPDIGIPGAAQGSVPVADQGSEFDLGAALAEEPPGLPPALPPKQPPPVLPTKPIEVQAPVEAPPALQPIVPQPPPRPVAAPEPPPQPEPPAPPVVPVGASPAVLEMPDRPPPLLMDVTPHSLGLETAGGYTLHLIRRNAPIPSEQSRVFTTAADMQDSVQISICQGEERAFKNNQQLGQIELSGLRAAPRGAVSIEVTFLIDASGTLNVKAVDTDTGHAQDIKINLLGGADEDEIERMRQRQSRLVG